jgi:hypothetical protein
MKNALVFGLISMMSLSSYGAKIRGLTAEARREMLQNAIVWQSTDIEKMNIIEGPKAKHTFKFDEQVSCQYVTKEMKGGTPKFKCAFGDVQKKYGTDGINVSFDEDNLLKVKYGKGNSEVFSEVLASRLFWALGFGADVMFPVQVNCKDCYLLNNKYDRFDGLRDSSYRDRDYIAAIEVKLKGDEILAKDDKEGWDWSEVLEALNTKEQNQLEVGAPREHIEAFKLLLAFIRAGDNKGDNNRFICLDKGKREKGDLSCKKPLLLMQDLGSTFGNGGINLGSPLTLAGKIWGLLTEETTKLHFEEWQKHGVWKDKAQCIPYLVGNTTGGLGNKNSEQLRIREKGRAMLASLLARLSDKQIEDLFVVSRVEIRRENTKVADWVELFKQKRSEIINHQCPD